MRLKMRARDKQMAKDLRGKTIARVIMYPFNPNMEGSHCHDNMATDPHIIFTDGTKLRFMVQETEGPEYGIGLILDD